MKKIGVLTSGGDAPGMNAAIRSVVRMALSNDIEVLAIRKGYMGLLNGLFQEMDARSVSDILHRGGTILQSSRCAEFREEAGVRKGVEMARKAGLEGIVVIGGDGSFRGARDLSLMGLPTIGIPATIDNDIACTELTIGFDTALETVKDALDKIRDTAQSHERCSVFEVMGRGAGYIAAYVAIACGAEAAIIPEMPFDFEQDIIKPIMDGKKRGKENNLIVVAEGVGGSVELAERIEKATGVETRATILGHIQRGGSPTVNDRMLASRMGIHAVKLLKNGIGNRTVAIKNNEIVDYDILEGLSMKKQMPEEIMKMAKILSL
ncbi:MAG: 6-phosphofructokinase [Ruminococcaceae bacterium]|nr:6-phosphofructokinase [Oscillospiraceae bacterium]